MDPVIFYVALVFFFLITFVRALPWPKELLYKKPLVCDACMTGWACIVGVGPWLYSGGKPLAVLVIGALTLLLLALYKKLSDTFGPPPVS